MMPRTWSLHRWWNCHRLPRRQCGSGESRCSPSTITASGQESFRSLEKLSSIVIPSSVKVVDIYDFSDCTNLASVTLPSTLEVIRPYAFRNCTSLESITFEGTVEQWNAVSKGTDWHLNVPSSTVVTCTDGSVAL